MGRRATIEQRDSVFDHYKTGKTKRSIAEIWKIPSPTVQHLIERLVRGNRVKNKGRKAPNEILTASDERWVIKK